MKRLLPIFFAMLLSGCATGMQPVRLMPLEAAIRDNHASVTSNGSVQVSSGAYTLTADAQKIGNVIHLHVILANGSKGPISFGPSNVVATDGSKRSLRQLDASELTQIYTSSASLAANRAQYAADSAQSDQDSAADYLRQANNEGGNDLLRQFHRDDEKTATNMAVSAGNWQGVSSVAQSQADALSRLAAQISVEQLRECQRPLCSVNPGTSDEGTVYFSVPDDWPLKAYVTAGDAVMTAMFAPAGVFR